MRPSSGLALCIVGSVSCGFIGYDPLTQGSSSDPAHGTSADASTLLPDGGIARVPADSGSLGTGLDGAVGSDGGVAIAPSGPPCGSLQLAQNDFAKGGSDTGWISRWYNGASVSRAHDRLEFALGGATNAEATYRSAETWDLRESELVIELGAGGSVTGFALRERALEHTDDPPAPLLGGVAIEVNEGVLNALRLDGTSELLGATAPYDAASQRYLRLREHAGQISWESSPDRATWTELYTRATPIDASAVRVELYARGHGANDVAWFDNMNLPASPSLLPYCSTSSLSDSFDEDAITPSWKRWFGAGTCTVEQQNGVVELRLSGSGLSLCGLVSAADLDLRDSAIAFQLVSAPDAPQLAAFADLSSYGAVANDRMETRVTNGTATMRVTHKPSPAAEEQIAFEQSTQFDATAQRFFRMRESQGHLYWDSSPDGQRWKNEADTDSMDIDASQMLFGLSASKNGGNSATAVVQYDNVNR